MHVIDHLHRAGLRHGKRKPGGYRQRSWIAAECSVERIGARRPDDLLLSDESQFPDDEIRKSVRGAGADGD